MKLQKLLVALALVFVIGGAAHAAELSTPAIFTDSGQGFYCSIVNVSSVPQTVRIRIYDTAGTVIVDTGNFALEARATSVVSGGLGNSAHCRFTTVNAKTLFRASAFTYANGTVAQVPAQ